MIKYFDYSLKTFFCTEKVAHTFGPGDSPLSLVDKHEMKTYSPVEKFLEAHRPAVVTDYDSDIHAVECKSLKNLYQFDKNWCSAKKKELKNAGHFRSIYDASK